MVKARVSFFSVIWGSRRWRPDSGYRPSPPRGGRPTRNGKMLTPNPAALPAREGIECPQMRVRNSVRSGEMLRHGPGIGVKAKT